MSTRHLAIALMMLFPAAAGAQTVAPGAAGPAAEKPPPPTFKIGMAVIDRAGVAVGQVKGVAESESGPIVVVEIDGKLVGVPQRTLALEADKVRSAQTRSQMLAAAGAPR